MKKSQIMQARTYGVRQKVVRQFSHFTSNQIAAFALLGALGLKDKRLLENVGWC